MGDGILSAAYIASAVLFILSLGGLSNQEKAKRAVWYGIFGMAIAVIATIFGPGFTTLSYVLLIPLLGIGALIGKNVAQRVEMTEMPQLVAALHSFVGLAAVFIGLNSAMGSHSNLTHAEVVIHEVEIFLGVFIGAITFTGSIVAYAKLAGKIDGKALILPGRHILNGMVVILSFILLFMYINTSQLWTLYLMLFIAFLLGAHLVAAIGGADMPVVVSMLNSYSGWAAAATGFLLGNDLLIVTGALVGSSGAILSYIMCRAMNRHFIAVILGGFGGASGPAMDIEGEQIAIDCNGVASSLEDANSVIIVPGYGMAVAQAQQSVAELTRRLINNGTKVRFGIHPVAGRLPGHMNVLLAEADVDYSKLIELEQANDEFKSTDVAVIVGANDVVNPDAIDDSSSPLFGMPILKVWEAKQTIVLKRSMSAGYAGVQNPLFFRSNNKMYFGDAKESLNRLSSELKTL